MKTGIFGGAFDPIHEGHIKAAQFAMEKEKLDRIIFIPSGISPFKGSLKTDAIHRLNMVRLSTEEHEGFFVSDMETKKKTPSYTYDTLCELKKIYPEDELYFIMGDDQYRSFNKWYEKDKLLSLCTFLVVTRDGGDILPPFVPIPVTPYKASSTDIRCALQKGEKPDALMDKVYQYIRKNNLYGGKP